MGTSKTNCRSKVGITVGLIDAMISIARVLAPQLKEHGSKAWGGAIYEALEDLTKDKDMLYIAGHHESSKIRPLSAQDIKNRELMDRLFNKMKDNDEFERLEI